MRRLRPGRGPFRSRRSRPILLFRDPLLRRATSHWLDGLSTRVRACIVCSAWIANRQDVGSVLLSTPAVPKPTSASVCGVCAECWQADLPVEALERAAITALAAAVPNGRFERGAP